MNNKEDNFPKIFRWMLVAFVIIIVVVAICAGILLFGGAPAPAQEYSGQGIFGGLQNGDAGRPPLVTQSDLEKEYQSRDPVTLNTQVELEDTIRNKLSMGDFSTLDQYLMAQQKKYKNGEGDENQAIADWSSLFGLYRSDLAATINLTADNAAMAFRSYACPDVLAAAIAYSPVSIKMNAFEDWSAIILPQVLPEDAAEVDLQQVDLDNGVEALANINRDSNTAFIDLVAYDMTLYGYRCRITIVADETGFYRPYSLQCLNEGENDFLTKTEVQEIKNNLPSYTELDDIIRVTKNPLVEEDLAPNPQSSSPQTEPVLKDTDIDEPA